MREFMERQQVQEAADPSLRAARLAKMRARYHAKKKTGERSWTPDAKMNRGDTTTHMMRMTMNYL